jgi:hypothetical protein
MFEFYGSSRGCCGARDVMEQISIMELSANVQVDRRQAAGPKMEKQSDFREVLFSPGEAFPAGSGRI